MWQCIALFKPFLLKAWRNLAHSVTHPFHTPGFLSFPLTERWSRDLERCFKRLRRRFSAVHTGACASTKVLQSDYFTSKLNSPHLCVAEKRELYVNNTAVPDTSLALFDRRTPPVEDKYNKTNPFINKLSARKHTSTEENLRGGDVALEKAVDWIRHYHRWAGRCSCSLWCNKTEHWSV